MAARLKWGQAVHSTKMNSFKYAKSNGILFADLEKNCN